MDLETAKALHASIEHWYQNWRAPSYANISGAECPLCALAEKKHGAYDAAETDFCQDCPVYLKSGKSGCANTPYMDVSALFIRVFEHEADWQELRNAIEAEYRFLVSLIEDPEDERQS